MVKYTRKRRANPFLKKYYRTILLPPTYEAALLAYIALYDDCNNKCRRDIGKIIELYGRNVSDSIVYRGQGINADSIKKNTPFISTTPVKDMAELFVGRDWNLPEGKQRVCCLFKIHLMGSKILSTRDIKYTYSEEVLDELQKIYGDKLVKKGGKEYSFNEWTEEGHLKRLVESLVYEDSPQNGPEILILNNGTFYKDKVCTKKGVDYIGNGDYETWHKGI